MSYCPRCDMEFVDGVTVCTDCGGPLAESREAAMAMKKKEQEEMLLKQRDYLEQLSRELELQAALEGAGDGPGEAAIPEPVKVYETSAQKYENLRSSASAFLFVGGLLVIVSAVCWLDIINLPMTGSSGYIFKGALTAMAVFCLGVYAKTSREAKNMRPEIDREKERTSEIIHWFLEQWTGESIDNEIQERDSLTEEELSLKRFQIIQDHLITNRDLPDQAYVDALCEEIYSRMYES